MLERQLDRLLSARPSRYGSEKITYTGNLDTRAQVGGTVDFRAMQTSEDAAEIRGKGGKHFRALTPHAHKADSGLWVYAHLDTVDDANCIDLSLPPG